MPIGIEDRATNRTETPEGTPKETSGKTSGDNLLVAEVAIG